MSEVFDDSQWPIVFIRLPEKIDDITWEQGMVEIAARLARKESMVFITLSGGVPTPKQRKDISDFFARHEVEMRRYLKGWGVVIASAAMRGVLTAITWLRPPPFDQKAFSTTEEAIAWAKQRLKG